MVQAITMPQQEQDRCKKSFEQFVQRYQLLLYKKAYEVLQNHHDAEDAVQDALLKAYEHFLNYTEDRRKALKVQAWLCTIVQKTAFNMRRDKKSHDPLETTGESQYLEILDTRFEAPEVALMREETWEAMHRLTATLPTMIRFLVKLRFVLEYKYDSLALLLRNQLGLEKATSGALRTQIHRGMALLHTILEKGGIDVSDLEAWSEWSSAFDEPTEFDEEFSTEKYLHSYLDLHLCSPQLRFAKNLSEEFENWVECESPSPNLFDSRLCMISPYRIFRNRSNIIDEGKSSGHKTYVESTLVDARQIFLLSPMKE